MYTASRGSERGALDESPSVELEHYVTVENIDTTFMKGTTP
jgi:hypothetical protein